MQRGAGWRQRWLEYQPSKTHAFCFALASVVAVLIVGFGFAGWVTAGTARQRADDAQLAARHELAAAVCVEEFTATNDAAARLVKLKDRAYWERTEFVAKGGWATMPDRKDPNRVVASMCAARLSEIERPGS